MDLQDYRKALDGSEQKHAFISFSPAEAVGLSLAIEQSIGVIAFGMPEVRARPVPMPSEAAAPLRMAAGAESLSDFAEDDPF